jgi:hypothetical protein
VSFPLEVETSHLRAAVPNSGPFLLSGHGCLAPGESSLSMPDYSGLTEGLCVAPVPAAEGLQTSVAAPNGGRIRVCRLVVRAHWMPADLEFDDQQTDTRGGVGRRVLSLQPFS